MTTTRSFSKDAKFGPSYRAALKAQFPFAIVSGILFLILFIVVFFLSTVDQYAPETAQYFYTRYFQQGIYAEISQSIFALIILAVIALASTLVGLSYLHKKSTVDVYHSLPVTRPQLLGANLLATLTAALGPYLAMYLLTMIIQLISCGRYGCFNAEYFRFIFFDIMSAIVYTAVIVAFVALVAVNVGTVFDAFAATMAIGFSPPLIYTLSGSIWQNLVYGATFDIGENWMCLSPFMFIFKVFTYMERYTYTEAGRILGSRDYVSAAWVLLLGLLAAAVLFVAAVVCYRRRKSEIAEQTQPRGVLQMTVKLIAAFIGGSVFFAIFNDTGFVVKIIATLLGAAGIGLIAEIILSRGVRWVGKNLKWLIGAGAVYCLLLIGVQADVFGYTSRVPELDSIVSVRTNYQGSYSSTDQYPYDADGMRTLLTDPESIAIVRDMHSIAVNNRPPMGNGYDDNFDYDRISIEYKLKNGSTMRRTYNPIYPDAYRRLADLESRDDFINANSALFWAEEYPEQAKVNTVELHASIGNRNGRHVNVMDNPEPLLDAIRADMLEQSLQDIINPSGPALGFIYVKFEQIESEYRNGYYYGNPYAIVTVTREYTRTIEVLRQLDLDGNFIDEPLQLGNVVRAGLAPTWEQFHYSSSRVQSFTPWTLGNEFSPWATETNYSEKDIYQGNIIVTRTDAVSIKAIAEVSKDTLFTNDRQDWHKNYVIVYFEMADGSYIVKAVKLNDLPTDIRDEARKEIDRRYSEMHYDYNAVAAGPVAVAETEVTAVGVIA